MKFLVALACLLAVASAGYAPIGYTSEARLVDPVAVAAGAPLPVGDTYEVAQAKAAHFAAHAAAKGQHYAAAPVAYSGYAHPAPVAYTGYAHAAPVFAARTYTSPVVGYASEPRQVDPVAIAAGAPLPTGDTVEVAQAKAAHLAVHAAAKGHGYATPAVAYSGYPHAAPLVSEARQVDPVAIAAGAPLPTGDTYEVAAAKAAHLRAHAAAKGHFIAKRSPVYLASTYTSPLTYTTPLRSYGLTTYTSPLTYSHPYYTHY